MYPNPNRNEISVIRGSLSFIKRKFPLIIIEFSKYTLDNKNKVEFLKFFLSKFNYLIYDTNNKKVSLNNILIKLNKLKNRHKTIGNYYLVKNSSKNLRYFNNLK